MSLYYCLELQSGEWSYPNPLIKVLENLYFSFICFSPHSNMSCSLTYSRYSSTVLIAKTREKLICCNVLSYPYNICIRKTFLTLNPKELLKRNVSDILATDILMSINHIWHEVNFKLGEYCPQEEMLNKWKQDIESPCFWLSWESIWVIQEDPRLDGENRQSTKWFISIFLSCFARHERNKGKLTWWKKNSKLGYKTSPFLM